MSNGENALPSASAVSALNQVLPGMPLTSTDVVHPYGTKGLLLKLDVDEKNAVDCVLAQASQAAASAKGLLSPQPPEAGSPSTNSPPVPISHPGESGGSPGDGAKGGAEGGHHARQTARHSAFQVEAGTTCPFQNMLLVWPSPVWWFTFVKQPGIHSVPVLVLAHVVEPGMLPSRPWMSL